MIFNRKTNIYSVINLLHVLNFIIAVIVAFIILKYGYHCHWDEWTGRGLYPGLAMANGIDIHDLKKSPLITGYGSGMALFYSPSVFASSPLSAIWIAYSMNIAGIILLFVKIKSLVKSNLVENNLLLFLLLMIFLSISFTDPTLNYIFQIHADFPSLFFLLFSLILYKRDLTYGKLRISWFISCLWAISFWTKITILPSFLIFLFIPLFDRSYKISLTNFFILFISTISIFMVLSLFYDLEDIVFFTFKSSGGFEWSDRNMSIFEGNGNLLTTLSDKINLLIKMMGLYANKYWYYVINSFLFLTIAVITKKAHRLVLPLAFFLLLPSCLAALSKWGGIENSLIFCNCIALLLLLEVIFCFFYSYNQKVHKTMFLFALSLTTILLLISPLRVAKSIDSNIENSPNNQAFKYLQKGNDNIYFGWYPISHYFHENKFYSSLSLPTYMAIISPEKCTFNRSHLPPNTEYIALLKDVPYGQLAVKEYIGDIEISDNIEELSHWSIFKINFHK